MALTSPPTSHDAPPSPRRNDGPIEAALPLVAYPSTATSETARSHRIDTQARPELEKVCSNLGATEGWMAGASEEVEEEEREEKGVRGGEEKEEGLEEEWTYPEGGLRAWGVVLVSLSRRRPVPGVNAVVDTGLLHFRLHADGVRRVPFYRLRGADLVSNLAGGDWHGVY